MFERTDDQQLFEETTRRFLEAELPLTAVRDLARTGPGFDRGLWAKGAELGWTSLLVPEEAGGASVSGNGVVDLALVAYQFGRHAAPGPLLATNLVAAALGRFGTPDQQAGPLAQLMAGEAIATWAFAEPPPHDELGEVHLAATPDGDGFVLEGTKSPVEAGADADHVLVAASHDGGVSQFLVPRAAAGLTATPLRGIDLTRRFARLDFRGVHVPATSVVGEPKQAAGGVAWLADLAVAVQLAEMAGAMRWAFDTTVEWAFNRYSFGRPLASYQEIKHRFADMAMWLEATDAIAGEAARAVGDDVPNRAEVVSAAKCYAGRYGPELVQDCVQLHGGIGITFDHDLHLFLRRVATDVPLFGTPGQHAARLTAILEAREASE